MITKRELFNIYNQKIPKPKTSTAQLNNGDIKAIMRFCHSRLISEMSHIPPDSELGMDMQREAAYYQEMIRSWWKEKCDLLRAKENKARPENPETLNYIHN